MVLCKIEKCLPNNVYRVNVENVELDLVLEFYGVNPPVAGDSFVLHEDLLDINSPEFTQPYAFQVTDRVVASESELDIETALLKTDNNIFVLKRIYG